MTAILEFFEVDGSTPATAPNWGVVRPGQSGADQTRLLTNTGDADATGITVGISAAGPVELEQWVTGTVGGQAFDYTLPYAVGALAAGASLSVVLHLSVPGDAALSSTPVVALLYADWDN